MRRGFKGRLYEETQTTGLPIALELYDHFSTLEERVAILALLRATIRPPFAVSDRIGAALEGGRGSGWLSIKPRKLKGLPGVTFVWTYVGRRKMAMI